MVSAAKGTLEVATHELQKEIKRLEKAIILLKRQLTNKINGKYIDEEYATIGARLDVTTREKELAEKILRKLKDVYEREVEVQQLVSAGKV